MSIRFALLPAVAALLIPGAAQAQTCSMPAALAQRVCADAELAKLDRELVAKEQKVQSVTSRPSTWTVRARQFREELADGTDGEPLSRAELIDRIVSRTAELDNEIVRAKGIAAVRDANAVATGSKCLSAWLSMNCTVPMSGVLRDGDGTKIVWQFQSGASEADGGATGVLLWDASRPGAPKLIGWTFEGVMMDAPRYNPETKLLWVPGRMVGTGDHNADILYQKRGDRWVEIDMGGWNAALEGRLPAGLGVWHGVDYSFSGDAMGAETDLWKDSDANCCATGGRANLEFVIEGDALKLTGISAQTAGPGSEWKDY
ncbi:hypothetical protein P1X14_18590 [Sphingomonas sp. AOB5]|uniref:hypothetical protein n=1 Tax=Sphingomonas sp. AOB5 TaxID=3034017 RepID=UPI0023F9DC30|nr:hypothetical protein [Sphingomonas sp. AOB5]MDF7777275.1 hypothetical protein [Sphingomonas sp. AOB5]